MKLADLDYELTAALALEPEDRRERAKQALVEWLRWQSLEVAALADKVEAALH